MRPNLLMRAWMMAHVYGAEYQAVVCCAGSSGEVAFRESLCPQYTSDRHDAKGLRTYHITGTCGGKSISRIACGHAGREVAGANTGQLHITITSNTHTWQVGDLTGNEHLVSLDLDMQSIVRIVSEFLPGCTNLRRVNLASLRAVEMLPRCFLTGCQSLEVIDLSPLANLRAVGEYFMSGCTSMKSIDLAPLRAVEVLPYGFLYDCISLRDIDLSPLMRVRGGSEVSLQNCTCLKAIKLAPRQSSSLVPKNIRSLVVREEDYGQL